MLTACWSVAVVPDVSPRRHQPIGLSFSTALPYDEVGGGGGVGGSYEIVSVICGLHLPLLSWNRTQTVRWPFVVDPPVEGSVRSQEIVCGIEPKDVFEYVLQVLPSLETLIALTPLTSSRPSTSSLTAPVLVLLSTWLIVTVPLGASLSAIAPLEMEKTVIAELSDEPSRASSALLGLS